MTCRMCNEQDNFCDGNSSEQLCKNCYAVDFFKLPSNLYESYKPEPEYFTFCDEDIEDYNFECEHHRTLVMMSQRKKEIKVKCKKQEKKERKKKNFERKIKEIEDDFMKPRIQKDNSELYEEISRLEEIKYLKKYFGNVTEEEIIIKINEEKILEGMEHIRVIV